VFGGRGGETNLKVALLRNLSRAIISSICGGKWHQGFGSGEMRRKLNVDTVGVEGRERNQAHLYGGADDAGDGGLHACGDDLGGSPAQLQSANSTTTRGLARYMPAIIGE